MLRATSWIWTSLILAGWLIAAPSAFAQKKDPKSDPPRKVHDDAGLFSQEALKAANAEIAEIKRVYHRDLLIETKEKGPDDKQEFRKWAEQQAREYRIEGIYVVITNHPHRVQIEVGKETLKKGIFTPDNETDLRDLLINHLKKKSFDDALRKAVAYVHDAFRENGQSKVEAAAPVAPAVAQIPPVAQVPHREPANAGLWGGIGGIICLVVVALLVFWVIFGLIRAMSGGYGGGYGPGYGGGYGYGGGGFFPGLLGGMFGAAAGMWMYNSMFGGGGYGSTTNIYNNGGAAGGQGGNADAGSKPEPTDVGSGYSGAGGDYGDDKDDAAGGAGGGDWGADGGGGDAGGDGGGGGDWGGGGGDAGGGGDWGGGGDAGGGGGDWGGGGDAGGGGDWGGGGAVGGGGGDFGGGGGDFGGGGGGGGDW